MQAFTILYLTINKNLFKVLQKKITVTEKISREIVSIPNFPLLKIKEINKIVRVINSY